jgi:hypothetical protein
VGLHDLLLDLMGLENELELELDLGLGLDLGYGRGVKGALTRAAFWLHLFLLGYWVIFCINK